MKLLVFSLLAFSLMPNVLACNDVKDQNIVLSQNDDRRFEYEEKISKKFNVNQGDELAVYNLNGPIVIEGVDGNEVTVDVVMKIKASTNEKLENAKSTVKIDFEKEEQGLVFFTSKPYNTKPQDKVKYKNYESVDYEVYLSYTVKVPNYLKLKLSTINDGDILVDNVNGKIKVNNINGQIKLNDVKDALDVRTINGDVIINFNTNPAENASFYTLNGNVEITVPDDLQAICQFKTFNGEFFTNFDDIENLPSVVKQDKVENSKGTTYKVNSEESIKFGKGGAELKLETFNGDITVKKQ
jgi:DUF4097 and DUF4098 domain-containing protein YvlB